MDGRERICAVVAESPCQRVGMLRGQGGAPGAWTHKRTDCPKANGWRRTEPWAAEERRAVREFSDGDWV